MAKALRNKSKTGLSVLILLLLFGCKEEKKEGIPANVVPMRKMEKFLYELHRLEAELLISGVRQDTLVAVFEKREKDLYARHHLDSAKVNRSLRYYTTHIELLDSMYKHLQQRVQAEINPKPATP